MQTRIQARAIVLDPEAQAILLVRNPNAQFWYVPGGGLEPDEDLKQCVVREVLEETGLHAAAKRLLYVQELHDADATVIIELFWLAELSHQQTLSADHHDPDPEGGVAEARWFTREQLQPLTVYPKELKNNFWEIITSEHGDPFLGSFT